MICTPAPAPPPNFVLMLLRCLILHPTNVVGMHGTGAQHSDGHVQGGDHARDGPRASLLTGRRGAQHAYPYPAQHGGGDFQEPSPESVGRDVDHEGDGLGGRACGVTCPIWKCEGGNYFFFFVKNNNEEKS